MIDYIKEIKQIKEEYIQTAKTSSLKELEPLNQKFQKQLSYFIGKDPKIDQLLVQYSLMSRKYQIMREEEEKIKPYLPHKRGR